jgi:uncharacterized protein YcfJ
MLKQSFIAAGAVAMLMSVQTVPSQAASRAYCEDYATRVAYREGRGGGDAGDVLAGTAGGAIAGGAIGALVGKGRGKSIGKGAIIGGVAGTVLGAGAASSRDRDGYIDRRAYNRAYRDCREEDVRVDYRPRRGANRDDVQYCIDRFRSYNPRTGQYLTNSGQYRDCP